MKRLLILNLVLVTALFIAAVVPNYYINYDLYVSLSLMDSLAFYEWQILVGILAGGGLFSALLATIKLKKLSYMDRLIKINIIFHTTFLLFISYNGVLAILKAKREYSALLSVYRTKADADIKNGLIVYETAGLELSGDLAEQINDYKVDSLMRTYGLEMRNIGCMITAPLLKAQAEYKRITTPYLDRRNGPGWRHRMESQIKIIRKSKF